MGDILALAADYKREIEELKLSVKGLSEILRQKQFEDWASAFIPLEKIEEIYGLNIRWMRNQQKRGHVHLIELTPKKFFISRKELHRFMMERESGFNSIKI